MYLSAKTFVGLLLAGAVSLTVTACRDDEPTFTSPLTQDYTTRESARDTILAYGQGPIDGGSTITQTWVPAYVSVNGQKMDSDDELLAGMGFPKEITFRITTPAGGTTSKEIWYDGVLKGSYAVSVTEDDNEIKLITIDPADGGKPNILYPVAYTFTKLTWDWYELKADYSNYTTAPVYQVVLYPKQ